MLIATSRLTSSRLAGWAAGLVALVLLPPGCAINPVSGNPEVVFASREDEIEAGKQASEQVASQLGLMPDSARTAYVSQLGASLAKNSPRQDISYEFHIIDMPEPNAFALPGGYVYVSRGLLLLANEEDALAGAIGHEIGHAAARHSVQRQTAAAPLAILSGVTAGLVGIISPSLGRGVGAVTGLANTAVLAPYGRSQERESDRIGQEIAAKTGYAPDGISAMLESLGREQALHEDANRGSSFLSTHPSSAERVEDTREYAAELTRSSQRPLSSSRAVFLRRLDGLVVGDRAAAGVFVDEVQFLHPEMNFKLRFPAGWETHNSNQYVGAVSPDEDAAVIFEVAATSKDPVASGRAFLAEKQLRLGEPQPIEVHGFEAARVTGVHSRRSVVLTWILHQGSMYQITAIGPEKRSSTYLPMLLASSDSFDSITRADRAKIRESRIRLFTVVGGESVADVVRRAGSEDKLELVAVINGIRVSDSLEAGRLLKIPVLESYR